MSKRVDGGPAFPRPGWGNAPYDPNEDGISIRDYFATQALAEARVLTAHYRGIDNMNALDMASVAYEIADAMLKERAKAVSHG